MTSGFAWARNRMAIEKKFLGESVDMMFLGISFLQRWRVLLKLG
ncbi:hypothetical protein BS78_04G170300 [Paspalum vaginatum]|nr:hypothetical protein BS78_04G170300 [Paspalum vaginatum]